MFSGRQQVIPHPPMHKLEETEYVASPLYSTSRCALGNSKDKAKAQINKQATNSSLFSCPHDTHVLFVLGVK